MAQTLSEQTASYPLAAYNFRVTVGTHTLRFAKVSGLQREYQTLTYRHGLSFIEGEQITKYRVDQYATVTLEQGVVGASSQLHEWLERMDSQTMEIMLCGADGKPVMGWRATKVIPVKLTAPTFDASTNAVAIDSLEVKAAGISVIHY
jgi:phage tail-like protein